MRDYCDGYAVQVCRPLHATSVQHFNLDLLLQLIFLGVFLTILSSPRSIILARLIYQSVRCLGIDIG